jgi:hypothetical protein
LLSNGGSDNKEQGHQNKYPHREPPYSSFSILRLGTQDSALFFAIGCVVGTETQMRAMRGREATVMNLEQR